MVTAELARAKLAILGGRLQLNTDPTELRLRSGAPATTEWEGDTRHWREPWGQYVRRTAEQAQFATAHLYAQELAHSRGELLWVPAVVSEEEYVQLQKGAPHPLLSLGLTLAIVLCVGALAVTEILEFSRGFDRTLYGVSIVSAGVAIILYLISESLDSRHPIRRYREGLRARTHSA